MRSWGFALVAFAACSSSSDSTEILNPPRDAYGTWEKVEFPGTVCGNNTPFKMFTNFSKDSDNLVVVFEPGGACWHNGSSTGKTGIRGAAGGVGSLVYYHFLRNGVHAAEKAYLLDDSGPIFPSSGYSGMMHAKIRIAWNLDSLASLLPAGANLDDMGSINTALADEFPHDRLATTFFQRDDDFSLYSYERFYNFPPKDEIMRMWASDAGLLVNMYATKKHLYYFLPYYRNVNASHCTFVMAFAGSDIEDHNMTLAKWVNDFVDDKPVVSMREAPVSGEDGTP